ncbi:MAG: hypothetical protein FJ221_00535 [Lentisphaerae bacterium]|nr:hypothetical protein [Lentisphaerota bacterium]
MNTRVFVAVGVSMLAGLAPLRARAQDLLVVPARYSVLQVMFDVVKLRPSGLVSYQGGAASERPALHAWNGQEWVRIALDSLRDGSFAEIKPKRIVLIGDADNLPPVLADAAQQLAPVVMNWTGMDNASIVNAAGKLYKFDSREWSWIASRYNMQIKDANSGRRQDSWYYRDHPELRGGAPIRKPAEWTAPAPAAPAAPAEPAPVAAPPAPAVPAPVEPAAAFSPNAMWEQPAPATPGAPAERGIK